ncbi:MAG: YdcF family protein [Muricoprocola sp.]
MKYYDYLTEFIFREDEPASADMIFIPGSGYGELAVRAAEIYKMGFASQIIVSGKYSVLLNEFAGPISPEEYVGKKYHTESEFLAQVLMDHGVPESAIRKEEKATFTYENALRIRNMIEEEGVPEKAILVCQAFHAKRSLMYFQLVFPETEFILCPAITQGITRDNWQDDPRKIDIVLGEVERCGSQFHDIMKGTDKLRSLS